MKRRWLAALALVIAGSAAPAAAPRATIATNVPHNVLYLLSAFETLPSREQLVTAIAPDAPIVALLELIYGTDPEIAITVRLRSIRALGQLPESPPVRAALTELIAQYKDQRSGTGIYYLIAAIESLGHTGTLEELDELLGVLAHPSRDVQIAVVRSLRVLALPQATNALRDHYVKPTTHEAVRNEISEALQVLEPQGRR